MVAVIDLEHHYVSAPQDVWALATDFEALAEVCRPLIVFEGLPEGRCEPGLKETVQVRLFGIMPAQPYTMEIEAQNDAEMWFQSSELGAGVKSWRHTLRVKPNGTGATLTDHIEIDAGFLTPLFAMWARKLYRHRHPRRLRLLGEA